MSCILLLQHWRRNKPRSSPFLCCFCSTKRFAEQNLAAGGIHFRRGNLIRARGPRKMLRHFAGTGKSSWMSCILLLQRWRRNKFIKKDGCQRQPSFLMGRTSVKQAFPWAGSFLLCLRRHPFCQQQQKGCCRRHPQHTKHRGNSPLTDGGKHDTLEALQAMMGVAARSCGRKCPPEAPLAARECGAIQIQVEPRTF